MEDLDAYCDELTSRGIVDYDRAECGRDYQVSKLFQLYTHTAADEYLDFGEGRGSLLIEAMRNRMFARVPEGPYDDLLAPAGLSSSMSS